MIIAFGWGQKAKKEKQLFRGIRRQLLTSVWMLAMLVGIATICSGKYSGGSGDSNTPYQIANAADLMTLANDANDYNKCFVLTADIDLDPNLPGRQIFTTAVIAPDNNNINGTFDGNYFTGGFDGGGHKIINMTINTNHVPNDYLGLFGYISGGYVINLCLQNISITGGDGSHYIGGIAGVSESKYVNINGRIVFYPSNIVNCSSIGSVVGGNGSFDLGGLVGGGFGVISRCYSRVTITGGNDSQELGGLAGSIKSGSGIAWSYSTGAVTAGNESERLGGLVGLNNGGGVFYCYSTGAVTGGDGSTYLGGLAGDHNNGSISSCYFLDVAGPNNSYGTPLTDEQMKQQSSFVGWDFNNIWHICETTNYPKLKWQILPGDIVCPDGVDFVDFAYFAERWLESGCDSSNNFCGGMDMDVSSTVDMQDLEIFAANWLSGE